MDRPYDDIPQQGRHQGRPVEEEPSTSVRTEPAPHPPEREPEPPHPAFGLYFNEAEGIYRIRSWQDEPPIDAEAGYTEVGTYDRLDALAPQLPEYARFIVFENPETGEAFYDKQGNITNWMPDERFVQVTLFRDETAAAAYVDTRRKKP